MSEDLPKTISTIRLRLEAVTYDEARAMLAGQRSPRFHPDYPRRDDLDACSMIPPGGTSWGPRHIVRAFDDLVVGSIGFFGPPDPHADGVAETEIGYGLVPDARGHGAATESVTGMLAEADRLGVRVRASVEPSNKASVRVLAKCGFTGLRGSDEDGNLVMVRPLPPA
ncbi:MAG TPA: GNAT family N-acetyltransferase [Marmoricola sp.]|nr:GNAT family N-acetyltransferase [Marmoricola sp.]